jgi:hypothetical protein
LVVDRLPPSRDPAWWDAVAAQAIEAYIRLHGAAVWAELEAVLGETPWVREHVLPDFPPKWGVDPLHLAAGRRALLAGGQIVEETAVLGNRPVSALIDGPSVAAYGRATAVREAAGTKRRLYRRLLQWTGTSRLCGSVAERAVETTLSVLAGKSVWLPPSARTGLVGSILGRAVPIGGPLDAAGAWPVDAEDLSKGARHFAVEVKNVRATLYPWSNEVWDLLAKLSAFPDVTPVLVARRIHPVTFRMFKDIGAFGVELRSQLFATEIDTDDFGRVTSGLSLHNAIQADPTTPLPVLKSFFGKTGPENVGASVEKWRTAAPLAAEVTALREETLPGHQRHSLWVQFANSVEAAGLYVRGAWAPREVATAEEDFDASAGWEDFIDW